MGTIANAKVTHYYNCYNGDFIGCLQIFAIYSIQKGARGLRIKKKSRSTNASGFFRVTCFSKTNN